jgi:hypothetical protein
LALAWQREPPDGGDRRTAVDRGPTTNTTGMVLVAAFAASVDTAVNCDLGRIVFGQHISEKMAACSFLPCMIVS